MSSTIGRSPCCRFSRLRSHNIRCRIAAVAEAEDGDVVQLAAGEYTLSATITINRPLTVRGVNRLLTTVRASGTGFSLFKLQDPDAVVERMCLAGATASQGPAVYVDTAGGQVLDCLVAGNTSTVSGDGAGADIGAVEHYDAGLIVGFSVDRTRVRAELDESIVLSPIVSGGEVETYSWTVTNAQGVAATGEMDGSGVLTVDPASPGVYSVALEVVGKSGSRAMSARDGVFTAGVVEAFVATDGGNVFPYDTEAKAARNFNDAWTLAVSGTVVRVAAGNYLLGQSLDLTDPIRIVGAGREVTELRLAEGVNGRLALLDNAKSSITGCTLAGGRLGAPTGQNGCGVKFESRGGLVEDCRITDCRPVGVVQHGTAVQIVGKGIVRRTMIDHCTQGDVANCWGTIRVYGAVNAVIDSCLVCSNAAEWGGGIYVEGTAYVTNCTFAANSAKTCGSDLYLYTGWTNARFCNCVFAEAINGNDIHIATGAMTDEGITSLLSSSFDHCLSESCYVAIGGGGPTGAKLLPTEKGNLNELAGFSDAAAGDYRPGRGSPLLAGGLLVPGMKKRTDLEGHPLVVGGKAPIGCYASPFKPGLLLLIR